MILVVGQRMIRTDDGMKGTVELVQLPGFADEFERRIVYFDRGEKRVAGKREVWEPERAPPRKLRPEEIQLVAHAADQQLRAVDRNEPFRWWEMKGANLIHDQALFDLIIAHLQKRG